MKLKNGNSGISLIGLIITIIVIIILAAIVIFSGMGTPEKAQLSKVISDIDNVQAAVDQAYYGLYTEKAVAGEVWTKSQFYEAVATGNTNRESLNRTGLVEIDSSSLVKINLPKYEGRKWYIAISDVSDTVKTGSAVLSPGFESDGKVYATLLDVQNGGSDGRGLNGGGLTKEEREFLASINIGDYVNYMGTNFVSGEGMMDNGIKVYWRVIDKNEETGEILITTSNLVGNVDLKGSEGFFDISNNSVNELDKFCKRNYTADGIGEINVRSMRIEDMDKLSRRYPITTGEKVALSIVNLPLDDLDALAQLYYGEGSFGRYAYYDKNTPDELVKDIVVTTDGKTVTYHGVKLTYENAKFLRYDISGETNTATSLANAKIPKYEVIRSVDSDVPMSMASSTSESIENLEEIICEPVLVSMEWYKYYVPEEVAEIIGDIQTPCWLASECEDVVAYGVYFGVRLVRGGYVNASDLYGSDGYSNSGTYAVRPVVTLNSRFLEQGRKGGEGTGEYNVWKLK